MYPTISDLINDLFGIYIPLPIQSFGFFVALAFLAAAYLLSKEIERKQKLGLIGTSTQKVLIGKPASTNELIIAGLIGFVLGYKILAAVLDYSSLVSNPQDFMLSLNGNFFGGILGAAFSIYGKYQEKNKLKLDTPKWVEETIQPKDLVSNITVIAAVSGILGAKIFHNLENLDEFTADPIDALLSFSGLTFYGGLICATFAVLYYTNKHKINWKVFMDAVTPPVMLAYGIGRMGCQVAGDGDWGIPNDNPKPDWLSWAPDWAWAYNYPNNVLGVDLKANFIRDGYESISGFAYPTPLYEVIMSFIIFGILWSMRKKITTPGIIFSFYLIFNGIERFLIEKIRVNTTYTIFEHKITQAEIISTALVLLGLFGIYYFKKTENKEAIINK